jgi:flagellar motor protein MotB
MRTSFDSPGIWPGFVDLFAGFALVLVASALSAQLVLERNTEQQIVQDRAFDEEIGRYVEEHVGENPAWRALAVDTSGVGRAKIALPGRITFDRKRSDLKPEAKQALRVLSGLLRHLQNLGIAKVYVTGFADTTRVTGMLPDGSTNNLELSAHRATNAAWFLTHHLALSDTFVVVSAMGDNMPIVHAAVIDTAASRRIEIVVNYHEPTWNGR